VRARYLLDTNICIYLLKGAPESLLARFAKYGVGEVLMSAITYAELAYGAATSPTPAREKRAVDQLVNAVPVAPFGTEAAAAYAVIRKAAPERRADALDKLIAAHAAALGVVVVTNNEGDFSRYPGIKVENWARA